MKGTVQVNTATKVFDKHINKLKIVKPEDFPIKKMDSGTFSIEYRETAGKKLYLTVFRAAFKPLFTGILTVSSRIKRVEEKAAKHQLKIAVLHSDPATKKNTLTHCTCNFGRHEDMANYETEFKKAIEVLKEQSAEGAKKNA